MLPRMRTCKQCIIELKQYDQNTAVTEHYLRDLIRQNKVVHVWSGRRILINFDSLLAYLNDPHKKSEVLMLNNIRQINA